MTFRFIVKFYLLVILFICNNVDAHQSAKMDVLINSDNLTFDSNDNIALFEGNVVVHFDNLILKTSLIKIFYKEVNNKKQIETILIPKYLTIIRKDDQTIITANEATYLPNISNLVLRSKVIIQYEDNIVKTEKLTIVSKLLKINDDRKKIEENK
ncbi:MAG: hypothetical protein EOP33_04310 [Rickettsiaceae bacterium]|nr:MAG: hypothetical protein EOP33_04310 [Rickettsiaceae bacterium]